jgi:hypothetical protein
VFCYCSAEKDWIVACWTSFCRKRWIERHGFEAEACSDACSVSTLFFFNKKKNNN